MSQKKQIKAAPASTGPLAEGLTKILEKEALEFANSSLGKSIEQTLETAEIIGAIIRKYGFSVCRNSFVCAAKIAIHDRLINLT